MKLNQNTVSIEILKSLEPKIKDLLDKPEVWKTLDVDYFPPRVERLYTEIDGYRVFLHTIHPTIARFIVNEGSYYEMTQTDCLHFVDPIGEVSCSIMITKDLYPEAEFRKESLDRVLNELSEERKIERLGVYKSLL